jgi:hypothetical protein
LHDEQTPVLQLDLDRRSLCNDGVSAIPFVVVVIAIERGEGPSFLETSLGWILGMEDQRPFCAEREGGDDL